MQVSDHDVQVSDHYDIQVSDIMIYRFLTLRYTGFWYYDIHVSDTMICRFLKNKTGVHWFFHC